MKIFIEVQDREVNRLLARLAERGGDLRAPMAQIGEAVVSNTRLRFSESRAPDGSAWQPLALSTLARRRQGNGGRVLTRLVPASAQPLLDTGQLRNSISFRAGGRDVVVGTNLSWARIHQFGGMAGRGRRTRIPARPILGISSDDRAEISAVLSSHFGGAL